MALLCGAALAAPKESEGPLNRLTDSEVAAGWVKLFDGETLFGWKANNDVNWGVTNGVVHADQGPPGLLLTTTEFADYELRCDFRLEKGGNSGIFLRSLFAPADPARDCYELNICDSHPAFPTGSLVGVARSDVQVSGEEEWHSYQVSLRGSLIEVKLDGRLVLTYTDKRPAARRRGLVGLQKNAGRAEYRNIFLRPLSMRPLFNGTDLEGWRVVPGAKSRFSVEDKTLRVQGGSGFLETESTWKDFVFQAQVQTHGERANGGIFFRAMRGTAAEPSNGYEAQILNAWEGDDRTRPIDFGTGGIHRRAKARRVAADDGQWFTMTIAAAGVHIATWVNGEPVTDLVDLRSPADNPRRGSRAEAGHISLQGHDEKTDLSFRNLRVVELPGAAQDR
jgi:hypothetical protein